MSNPLPLPPNLIDGVAYAAQIKQDVAARAAADLLRGGGAEGRRRGAEPSPRAGAPPSPGPPGGRPGTWPLRRA